MMDTWVDVGGTNYNIVQAPAVQQVELLNMIGAPIMARHAQADRNIDATMLVGLLLVLPLEKFNRIAGIVLYKTIAEGDKTKVDIGDFQGRSTNYYLLVAEAIKANLEDFFIYLQGFQNEEVAAEEG